uniref:MACPF domain-containing protein n=1 Tax=Clytia hemisphaerica TaxID=252671 RepID=A0A7M5TZ69_9CNID
MELSAVLIFTLLISAFFAMHDGSILLKESGTESKTCSKEDHSNDLNKKQFPIGDPRNCFLQDNTLVRMEVLPGTGWDNLRNLDMSMVVWKNYSQCLTSDDGKYLLPDNIFVIALKKSSVELTSEYFDHFSDYTSSTSTSINAEAHASGFGIGVSGKFSSEFQHIKKSQVENKAVTTKVQLRHKFYTVKAQPGIQLHPNFKSRLLDIAAHLQSNNTRVAQYLADLIVRDFGTHYITSIDAGAILEKIDHVKSSYAKSQDTDRSKITASASASFPFGGVSTSASHAANKSNVAAYQNNVAGSSIHTHGGAPYRANFTTDQWEDSLADNLIAIDKAGDPLYYAITSETLPELPDMLAIQLSSIVEDSIKAYYKHNIVKGCTNPDSPSFNFAAILDDKTCDKSSKNFTFGGMYQVCISDRKFHWLRSSVSHGQEDY